MEGLGMVKSAGVAIVTWLVLTIALGLAYGVVVAPGSPLFYVLLLGTWAGALWAGVAHYRGSGQEPVRRGGSHLP